MIEQVWFDNSEQLNDFLKMVFAINPEAQWCTGSRVAALSLYDTPVNLELEDITNITWGRGSHGTYFGHLTGNAILGIVKPPKPVKRFTSEITSVEEDYAEDLYDGEDWTTEGEAAYRCETHEVEVDDTFFKVGCQWLLRKDVDKLIAEYEAWKSK